VFPFFDLKNLGKPAIASGDLNVFMRIVRRYLKETGDDGREFYAELLDEAIMRDNVPIFSKLTQMLENLGDEYDAEASANLAAEHGSAKVLQHMLDKLGDAFPVDAAWQGWCHDVETFKWLVDKAKMQLCGDIYHHVFRLFSGKLALELADFLYSRNCPSASSRAGIVLDLYARAVKRSGLGALRKIDWLHAHGFALNPNSDALYWAIRQDNVCTVERLHELGCCLTRERVTEFGNMGCWDEDSQVAKWSEPYLNISARKRWPRTGTPATLLWLDPTPA
jgi:hypothetical protein